MGLPSEPASTPTSPLAFTDALMTAPVIMFLTRTSSVLATSPVTRLDARVMKATNWPSAVTLMSSSETNVLASACAPPALVVTSRVSPVSRSHRKTSWNPLRSPATRLLAAEPKAT